MFLKHNLKLILKLCYEIVYDMATNNFIEKQKKLYKTLEPCFCPAIQDTVYFNAEGLRHLLYDKHRPRNIKQKLYRVYLIDYITEAIKKAKQATKKSFVDPPCHLWILSWVEIVDKNNEKLKIKVILKKKGNGNIFFWSIMRKNNSSYRNPIHNKKTS